MMDDRTVRTKKDIEPTSNLDSLPSVIESVSHAQRHQFDQLTQHQEILQQSQVQLQTVMQMATGAAAAIPTFQPSLKPSQVMESSILPSAESNKVNEARKELTEYERKRFCQSEEIAEHGEKCAKHKKEIVQLLEEDFQLNTEIESLRKMLGNDQSIREEYIDKMTKHKASALELEKQGPIQSALEEQQGLLKGLQQQKEDLISSADGLRADLGPDPLSELKGEVESLKAVKEQLEQENKQREKQLSEGQQHQMSLQQDISVLKKRHHAQLLCLRNQVKEAQMRNRQWHEEACKLEQRISQLQSIISDNEA